MADLFDLDRTELLNKLQHEILCRHYDFSLPKKLSDIWLDYFLTCVPLDIDYEPSDPVISEQEEIHYAAVILLIEHLLEGQHNLVAFDELERSGKLSEYFYDYLSELVCEYDFRQGAVYYDQAEVDTILKGRVITIVKLKKVLKFEKHYELMSNIDIKNTH